MEMIELKVQLIEDTNQRLGSVGEQPACSGRFYPPNPSAPSPHRPPPPTHPTPEPPPPEQQRPTRTQRGSRGHRQHPMSSSGTSPGEAHPNAGHVSRPQPPQEGQEATPPGPSRGSAGDQRHAPINPLPPKKRTKVHPKHGGGPEGTAGPPPGHPGTPPGLTPDIHPPQGRPASAQVPGASGPTPTPQPNPKQRATRDRPSPGVPSPPPLPTPRNPRPTREQPPPQTHLASITGRWGVATAPQQGVSPGTESKRTRRGPRETEQPPVGPSLTKWTKMPSPVHRTPSHTGDVTGRPTRGGAAKVSDQGNAPGRF
ncbi:proline-rich protein 2-like [Salarias fasciatus]|uniref:proline-rich protein 2-like n=1 Tax=Salarias fasciatus TaxID=181472 RepID=UPI001176ED1B|nr:proline-rich protein 2-like [Salarias fasciatus]